MTEPKKTTRRTTRTRSGSTRSAAAKSPFEFTTPTEDTSHKVEQAMASLEELATPVVEAVAPPTPPEPNGSGAAAEAEVPAAEVPAAELPMEQLQQQLVQQLNDLVARLKELNPAFIPSQIPGAQTVLDTVQNVVGKSNFEKFRSVAGDLLDPATWKGALFILNSTVQFQTETVKRRLHGEYETDEWGFDPEVMEAVAPFFEFLYHKYWRVTTTGLEHVPGTGRALLVSNHSGQLPFDGSMLATAIRSEHPGNRLVRTMFASWFPTMPVVAPLFVKCGQVTATEDNGIRLLENEELVSVFPEGIKGVGKLYKDRYHLARFGRGGFIRMALKTQTAILPVSVVGAEETYMSLAKSDLIAKAIGFPFFPITPTFPWLGLLGTIPLPTKWYIDIGEPIPMDGYGPKADQNLMLVSQLTDQVRGVVQKMINERVAQRQSVFRG